MPNTGGGLTPPDFINQSALVTQEDDSRRRMMDEDQRTAEGDLLPLLKYNH